MKNDNSTITLDPEFLARMRGENVRTLTVDDFDGERITDEQFARFGYLCLLALGANDEHGADLSDNLTSMAVHLMGVDVGDLSFEGIEALRRLAERNGVEHDGPYDIEEAA
ncbi:hypothetical protein ACFVAJ_18035 [Agromyces sp. NPDC057679]|uniref:hypothetical protein n=1 Tax=Agromyces sp. NPDC057679 TaxID=3346207 RepID=UPI00366E1ACB